MSESGQKAPSDKNEGQSVTPPPANPMRGILAWVLILSMVLLMVHLYMNKQANYEEIAFNPDFVNLAKNSQLAKCEVFRNELGAIDFIQGDVVKDDTIADMPDKFKVFAVGDDTQKILLEYNVDYKVVRRNPFVGQLLTNILPVVIIFGLLYFFFIRQLRNAGSGAMSFGKSRAKMLAQDKHRVTFENVAGIDEAKDEVQEIIDFLQDPRKFQKLGGRIPKGVLLMGPPGTGKTLLAKAIAGEADVPFFNISGSDFVEMFVGVGASRVRDMFEQGKKSAPCLIFIDEIDAVGRSRFTGIGGGHDEREQTLNALLVEMDGFETQEGVIIIAATNRPDVLDQALLRPGRFDRQIVIDMPTIDGREAILKMHSRGIKLDDKVDMRRIARGTPGFSGADLANLLNEAALLAAREDKNSVEMADLEEARDKVKWGRERRSHVLDDKEKKVTAYHEAGHAIVMQMVEESEPLHKITIIPRGVAYLGATMQLPEKDSYMEGRTKLLGVLAGLMGGRVTEEIVFGDITSGASSDIKESTRLARLMVCSWGMSKDLGPRAFGQNQEVMFLGREINRTQDYSENTAVKIDTEVDRLIHDAHEKAKTIITENREKLELIAQTLLERETLAGRDVEEIVEHGRMLSEAERDEIDAKKEMDEADAKPKIAMPPAIPKDSDEDEQDDSE